MCLGHFVVTIAVTQVLKAKFEKEREREKGREKECWERSFIKSIHNAATKPVQHPTVKNREEQIDEENERRKKRYYKFNKGILIRISVGLATGQPFDTNHSYSQCIVRNSSKPFGPPTKKSWICSLSYDVIVCIV